MTVWFPRSREEEDFPTALALLRQVEWEGNATVAMPCPVCRSPQHVGHAPGCRLAWLLSRYPETKP